MHYHLLGICGTAMASAAVMLKSAGHKVSGSDQNVYPPMSTQLTENGIEIMNGYAPANLNDRPDCVVVGNVVSRGNPEVEAVLEGKLRYTSLPEVLKEEFIRGTMSFVVTGTHGKTTTTSLLAWILDQGQKDPGYLVGGIPLNFPASGRKGSGTHFVIEGDEYDTAFFDKRSKFVHYLPDVLIINNIEFDHADIFSNLDEIMLAFRRIANVVPRNGLILVNRDDENCVDVVQKALCPVETFSLSREADWTAKSLHQDENGQSFRVYKSGEAWAEFSMPQWGTHNLSNALVAIAAAAFAGVSPGQIGKALRSHLGVKRRLELRGERKEIRVYDDFAHHPTAIAATLATIKSALPGRKLWAVYEPRSNTSRTNRMQAELGRALAHADAIVLAGIYGAERVDLSQRLDCEAVAADLRAKGREAWSIAKTDAIVEHASAKLRPGDVVVGMSNGGFGDFHSKLLRALGSEKT